MNNSFPGDLDRVHVSHNNKGSGPGWFLDKIVVDDVTAGKVFLFPCHQVGRGWLFLLVLPDGIIPG